MGTYYDNLKTLHAFVDDGDRPDLAETVRQAMEYEEARLKLIDKWTPPQQESPDDFPAFRTKGVPGPTPI